MSTMSYTKLQRRYGNQFVANQRNRVVANGRTLAELFRKLKAKGIPYDHSIVIGHIPPRQAVCVYRH